MRNTIQNGPRISFRFMNQLGLVGLFVAAIASPGVGQAVEPTEMTVESAQKILKDSDEDDIKALVKKWEKATGEREWKDATGKYSVVAQFVEVKDKSVVLYRKDKGETVTVALASLDFNARVRAAEGNRLRTKVIEEAELISAKLAQKEAKRKKDAEKAAEEEKNRLELVKKREDFLKSLTPKQREILNLAIEKSKAGIDRQEAFFGELSVARNFEEGLRLRARFAFASNMLNTFAEHQKKGTLTADVVKKAINDSLGADGAMRDMEVLLFGPKSSNMAFVLLDEEKLLTRLDIYLAAAKTLHPEIRETYGFRHAKEFDRLGTDTYWQYMLKQESK